MNQKPKEIEQHLERLKRELRQHQSIAMTQETEAEVKQLMDRIKRMERLLDQVRNRGE